MNISRFISLWQTVPAPDPAVVALSGWMLLALLSSATTGFAVTIARSQIVGFSVRGIRRILKNETGKLALIAALDAAGAISGTVTFWLFWPARYELPINLSSDHPVVFWLIFGMAGPLITAGILKRAPAALKLPTVGGEPVGLAIYRKYYTDGVLASAETYSKLCQHARADWLRATAVQRARDRELDFDRLYADLLVAASKSKNPQHNTEALWRIGELRNKRRDRLAPTQMTERLVDWCIGNLILSDLASQCHVDLHAFNGEYVAGNWDRYRSVETPFEGAPGAIDELDDLDELDDPDEFA